VHSVSSGSGWVGSVVARPASRLRLVTTARQVGVPGSSGRTWSASRALSSGTSIPPARDQTAVQADLGVEAGRYPFRRRVECVEEPAYRVGRGQLPAARIEAAQVHVQLAVREPVRHPVRPVHGEGGLPRPRIVTH